jgi:hypothetical protein
VSGNRRYSPARMRALIAYLCQQSAGDRNFTVEKLLWLLFWADMEAYRKLGSSITGATYVKTELGPWPTTQKRAKAMAA